MIAANNSATPVLRRGAKSRWLFRWSNALHLESWRAVHTPPPKGGLKYGCVSAVYSTDLRLFCSSEVASLGWRSGSIW